MQFSKFMPLVCAAIVWSGFISVRADDTPAQAAARAALEQKMREAGPQGKGGLFFEPTTNSAGEAQPTTPIAVTASGVSETGGTNNLSAAEMALRAKMAELNAPVKNVRATAPATLPPPNSGDIGKARAELEEKMSELDQQPVKTPAPVAAKPSKPAPESASPAPAKPVAPEAPPAAEKPLNPADVNYSGKALGLKPIEAPALPVSAEVQSRLQELDAKYKAGQITPEEYHARRAAILGQP
jgi:hypothetical protein